MWIIPHNKTLDPTVDKAVCIIEKQLPLKLHVASVRTQWAEK